MASITVGGKTVKMGTYVLEQTSSKGGKSIIRMGIQIMDDVFESQCDSIEYKSDVSSEHSGTYHRVEKIYMGQNGGRKFYILSSGAWLIRPTLVDIYYNHNGTQWAKSLLEDLEMNDMGDDTLPEDDEERQEIYESSSADKRGLTKKQTDEIEWIITRASMDVKGMSEEQIREAFGPK